MSPKPPDILRKSHRHVDRKERAAAKERLRLETSEAAGELPPHRYAGACSCGAAGYRYRSEIPPSEWRVRACQCSFCTEHAAAHTTDPLGRVELVISDPSAVERRQSGLRKAQLICCRRCGDFVAALATTARGRRATVNVGLLEHPPADLPRAEPVSYGEETVAQRLERWATSWTPVDD